MAGVQKKAEPRSKRNPLVRYRCWWIDRHGVRIRTILCGSRDGLKQYVWLIERDERRIREGLVPEPASAMRHRSMPFAAVVQEYLDNGRAHGGRDGRPWASLYAANRESQLRWWAAELNLQSLGDLDSLLPRAEAALRGLQNAGRSSATLNQYIVSLRGAIAHAIDRGYLSSDPLEHLGTFSGEKRRQRRALTPSEIARLLSCDGIPGWRRILYETALLSGLRAGELRALSIGDVRDDGLVLRAAWCKSRKDAFQPLPEELVRRLREFGLSGEAKSLYRAAGSRRKVGCLLYVPRDTAGMLRDDMDRAGIPIWIDGQGVADFHSLRITFTSLVIECGASAKEAQALARHSTPTLTMNTYARTRDDRLRSRVDAVWSAIAPRNDGIEIPECQWPEVVQEREA